MINFDLNAAYFCIEIIHDTQKDIIYLPPSRNISNIKERKSVQSTPSRQIDA